MSVQFDREAATECIGACLRFISSIESAASGRLYGNFRGSTDSFDSARQIGTVYSLFCGADLQTLLNGFVTQVEAMSVMFSVAGGLLEAQDEAVAAVLGRAVQEPSGLQSAGLMDGMGPARHVDGPDRRPVGGRGAPGRALPAAQRAPRPAPRLSDLRRMLAPARGDRLCTIFRCMQEAT